MTPEEFRARVSTFDGAVDWATNALLGLRRVAPLHFEPDGEEKLAAKSKGVAFIRAGDTTIMHEARSEYWSYMALRLGAAEILRLGEQLPDWVASWVADELEQRSPAVPRSRGRPSETSRHRQICLLLEVLVDKGELAPYRNEDGTKPTSACDVLAIALKNTGLRPSTYGAVKKIFERWRIENGDNELALRSRAMRGGRV